VCPAGDDTSAASAARSVYWSGCLCCAFCDEAERLVSPLQLNPISGSRSRRIRRHNPRTRAAGEGRSGGPCRRGRESLSTAWLGEVDWWRRPKDYACSQYLHAPAGGSPTLVEVRDEASGPTFAGASTPSPASPSGRRSRPAVAGSSPGPPAQVTRAGGSGRPSTAGSVNACLDNPTDLCNRGWRARGAAAPICRPGNGSAPGTDVIQDPPHVWASVARGAGAAWVETARRRGYPSVRLTATSLNDLATRSSEKTDRKHRGCTPGLTHENAGGSSASTR
jgi:hypothetical protein